MSGSTVGQAYCVGGTEILSGACCRDLGILVCSDFTWSKHCTWPCSKAYFDLHLIRKSISSCVGSLRMKLSISLVKSNLAYYPLIW